MNCRASRLGVHTIFVLLLLAILLVVLAACGGKEASQTYDIEHNGKVFTVNWGQQTITVDGVVCRFEVSGTGNHKEFHVIYPDGSSYWWSQEGNFGSGGWSDDYDAEKYPSGETLWDVLNLEAEGNGHSSGKYIMLGLLLILLGAVNAAFPRKMWQLSYGWRYKNAEPSDAALIVGRIGGVIAVVAGVVCVIV